MTVRRLTDENATVVLTPTLVSMFETRLRDEIATAFAKYQRDLGFTAPELIPMRDDEFQKRLFVRISSVVRKLAVGEVNDGTGAADRVDGVPTAD